MTIGDEKASWGLYYPSEDEWASISEGVDQAERGESVPDDEMREFWKKKLIADPSK